MFTVIALINLQQCSEKKTIDQVYVYVLEGYTIKIIIWSTCTGSTKISEANFVTAIVCFDKMFPFLTTL